MPSTGGDSPPIDVAGQPVAHRARPEYGPMHWGVVPDGSVGRTRPARPVRRSPASAHDLPLDMPPHAIHGTAYRQPWHVEAVADDEMSMSCDLAWEFGGRAWQRVTVGDTSVSCVLGVAAGDRAMPAEIGWHPWFTKPLAMTFRPKAMYARDGEGIPTGELVPPPPGPWDDCFVNTDPVELHYADLTVTVSSDCDHWVVYDEPAARHLRRAAIGPARRVQPAPTGARARRTAGPDDDDPIGRWRPSIGVARSGDNALRIARPSACRALDG